MEENPMLRLRLTIILVASALLSLAPLQATSAEPRHEPAVVALDTLLNDRPDLAGAMDAAIANAGLEDIGDRQALYRHLDASLTWVPVDRQMVPRLLPFVYLVNQAPGDRLNGDDQFNAWYSRFMRDYGAFLDTPASAAGIESFLSNPAYRADDYIRGPSGWQTFNQFFAREIKPGRRPIAAPRDDRAIVSPADAVFMGSWPVAEDSTITIKGAKWRIAELLADSVYADAFKGGTYAHSFLYIDDYHRYHVPVAGTLKEVRNISGRVYMDVRRNPDGSLDVVDGDTYQFNQERGLVVIDSPAVGLVAVLPIGMSYVSSVNLTPDPGATLRKGDPFGYFMFGGSDIVMIFQDRDIVLDAEVGRKYLQGERIGGQREKGVDPGPP
jgi:phosphatidylserine decarboxylase precursor